MQLLRYIAGIVILAAMQCAAAGGMHRVSFFLDAERDLVSVTHGGQIGLAPFPPGIRSLAGTPVERTLLFTAQLRNEHGELVGIASELEVFPQTPMTPETVWQTWWTVVIPGRGALFAYQQERLTPAVATVMAAVRETGEDWRGELRDQNTVGPSADGQGIIVGGTGEFADARGAFLEIGTLRGYSARGELDAGLELVFLLRPTGTAH